MQKRTIWLSLIVLLAIAAAICLYKFTSVFADSSEFAIDDISKVSRIVIQKDTSEVILTKNQNVWKIDGTDDVKPTAIKKLLFMLEYVEVKSPLPKSMYDEISEKLDKSYTIVAEDKNGHALREYTIGEIPGNSLGSFGVLKGKNKIYLLQIPGISISPASVLSVDPSYWHKSLVLSASPDQIISINIDNIKHPENNIKISKGTDGEFHLFDVNQDAEILDFNKNQLNFYLSLFSDLGYRKLLKMDDFEFRTLRLSEPEAIISVATSNAKPATIKLYLMPIGDNYDEIGRPLKFDRNKFYLVFDNDTKVAEAAWIDYDLLLQDIKFFSKSNE